MKIRRISAWFVLFATLIAMNLVFALPTCAEEEEVSLSLEHATSAYLCNLEHNLVLFEENVDEKVYPTATVKMMVGLIASEFCGNKLDSTVTVTSDMLAGVTGNNIELTVGETLTYRDLLAATLVGGANDAATALAVSIDGSLSAFITRMNERANSLGAVNTHYTNASGMHDEDMYTTCADTAIIARAAYANSLYMEISSLEKYVIEPTNKHIKRTIHSKNALISRAFETKYYYKYASGMSSGYTKEGGYALVTTASLDGCTYLCVVMGAESDDSTIYSYTQATKLLRYAFSNYGFREVVSQGDFAAELPVNMSDDTDFVSCVPADSLKCYMPYSDDIDYAVTKTVRLFDTSLDAPVTKGQKVGTLTVSYEGNVLGNIDLVAASDIERSEFLFVLGKIKAFAGSRFFIATAISAVILFISYTLLNSLIRYRRERRRLK